MKLVTFINPQSAVTSGGQEAQLVCCQNHSRRFTVEFFAHFSNNVILVTMPKTSGAASFIRPGKKFQIRVAVDNVVYTFNTEVAHICQQPYICLRICNSAKLAIERDVLQQLSA